MAKWLDSQSKLIKILLFIPFWGGLVGIVYRIFKYIDSKETSTLVCAIVGLILGFFISIIDLVCVITKGEVTFFSK